MLFYLEHWGGAAERPILQRVAAGNLSPTALNSPQNRTLELLGWGSCCMRQLISRGPICMGTACLRSPDDLSLHAVKILILADTWVCLTDCRGELPAKLSNGAEEQEATGGPSTHPPPDTSRHSNLKRGHPRR